MTILAIIITILISLGIAWFILYKFQNNKEDDIELKRLLKMSREMQKELSFPESPETGTQHTFRGELYTWNGSVWECNLHKKN